MAGFIFLKIFLTSPYCFLPITCFPHFLSNTFTPLYCGKIKVGFFNSVAITGVYLDTP